MRTLETETCYRALTARDRRFDGLFFVGVSTTGIYCRPVCTARTPRQERCAFYRTAAEAEHAGFRACLLCRPELAPGSAPVDSVPRLVAAAVARIEAGCLNESSLEDLAAELGVTSRHLRRAMEAELGVSPVELAQSRRLALAKQLLQDTTLPLAEVAFASGFPSVRSF
ncbi:MAG TPA: Ada metal-binding domain-containing protein, partial [Archangium sp.]|nr:Ada metal-binding domain-containing protein [Archangium sp.]